MPSGWTGLSLLSFAISLGRLVEGSASSAVATSFDDPLSICSTTGVYILKWSQNITTILDMEDVLYDFSAAICVTVTLWSCASVYAVLESWSCNMLQACLYKLFLLSASSSSESVILSPLVVCGVVDKKRVRKPDV